MVDSQKVHYLQGLLENNFIRDEATDLLLPNATEWLPSKPFRRYVPRIRPILDDTKDFTCLSIEDTCLELEASRQETKAAEGLHEEEAIDDLFNDDYLNITSNKRKKTSMESLKRKKIKPTSKYIGVCWNKSNEKWQAQVYLRRSNDKEKPKYKYLGLYKTEKEAALEYDKEMKLLNPKIPVSRLNFGN